MKPMVSVVILNWNGKTHLLSCLASLHKVSYKPLEIIVVDNNSSDNSIQTVKKRFPKVTIVAESVNRGYSGGNNDGIKASSGEFVFILNNDTQVDKNFLNPLVRVMKDPNVGCVQPKLLYGGKRTMLNAVGSYLTGTGFLYHYGYRKDADLPQYNRRLTIYSAKGAAMLIRKSALDRVGMFDEDFFIYFEETDLCHRLWLCGYNVVYEPRSVIYHYEAVDTHRQIANSRIMYLSYRNRIASFIKNLSFWHVIKMIVILLGIYGFLAVLYLVMGQWSNAWSLLRAVGWNILMLPVMIRKRKHVQRLRTVTDSELFRIIWRNPPLKYYYYLFIGLEHYHHESSLAQKNRY